jgi:hypothetical protein
MRPKYGNYILVAQNLLRFTTMGTLRDIGQFVVAVVSHWQAYVTGGAVTGLLIVVERLSGKILPKKAAIFLGFFLLVSLFLAWDDEHQRADRLQEALNAKPASPPQVQVNVPPAQVVVESPRTDQHAQEASAKDKKPYPQNLSNAELCAAAEQLAKSIRDFEQDKRLQEEEISQEEQKALAPYIDTPQDQLTQEKKDAKKKIWDGFNLRTAYFEQDQDRLFIDRFQSDGILLRNRLLDLLPREERFSIRSIHVEPAFRDFRVFDAERIASELQILTREVRAIQ